MTLLRYAAALQQRVSLRLVVATTLEYLFRKPRIPESNWRQAGGRVAYAWHKNHWIVSNRLRPQAQPMQDAGCAVAAVDVA
jgi:hypothetical protein